MPKQEKNYHKSKRKIGKIVNLILFLVVQKGRTKVQRQPSLNIPKQSLLCNRNR